MGVASRFTAGMLSVVAISLPAQANAGRDIAVVLREIDQTFICPEFQPDDAARRAEVVAFSRALASVGPTRITYRKAAYIRAKMLQRHNCGNGATTVASADTADLSASGAAN